MQIVGADPIPPGESPWMTESQMLILLFTINLAVNSAILAAVLKVMRLKLGAKFVFVTFILTLGGLLLDTAANAASSNAIMPIHPVFRNGSTICLPPREARLSH